MKKLLVFLGAVVLIGLAAFGIYRSGYDMAVRKHEAISGAWSQVENQLQRRADLVPNLVNTVKGYAQQERDVFTEVTRLRSQWGQAQSVPEKIENANAMSAALSRLLLVSENYPELKSNENFLSLQSQLEGTENRIAVERMRYNKTVQDYNTFRRELIGGFFSRQIGEPDEVAYFEAKDTAQDVPAVEF